MSTDFKIIHGENVYRDTMLEIGYTVNSHYPKSNGIYIAIELYDDHEPGIDDGKCHIMELTLPRERVNEVMNMLAKAALDYDREIERT